MVKSIAALARLGTPGSAKERLKRWNQSRGTHDPVLTATGDIGRMQITQCPGLTAALGRANVNPDSLKN
jgi:hypothetical protein